ncbi:MAG: PASTA domain-containing protein [Armatimonadetes bacterium]|nr:PASTA domain-containing protein [Armatimonadota bacterium]
MRRPALLQSEVARELLSGCWATVGVIVVITVAAAVFSLVLGAPAAEVAVPNVIGLEPQAAIQKAREVGLDAEVAGDRYDDAIPAGQVCSTDPKPGRGVRKGRTIRLYVSRGPVNCVIPDLRGRPIDEARLTLTAKGLQTGEVYYVRSDYVKDTVVETNPRPGTRVPSGSRVDIKVSGGPDYGRVVLPDGSYKLFKRVIVRVPYDGANHDVVVERRHGRVADVLHDSSHPPGAEVVVDQVFEPGDRIRVYIDEQKVIDERVQ